MTRFRWAIVFLGLILLGEFYFFLVANHNKHLSNAKPVIAPLVFPEIQGPKPQANFRPLFTPGKDVTQTQQGFHLLGIVSEGNTCFALIQTPSGAKIVNIGDTIDGAEVIDIHKKDVILQAGETRIHLHLLEKGNFNGQ